jgi:hypothetical protein
MEDDFLGSSDIDEKGHVEISLTEANFKSKDSPPEKYPDIYFIIYRNNEEIYKSTVIKDLHLKKVSDFDSSKEMHYHLGTFLI